MAVLKRIVAIDVGANSLKIGEFHIPKPGTLTLLRYGITDLGLDPFKEENTLPYITAGLKKLMAETGIRPQKAFVSVSGQSMFMRFVKLPPVDPVQVEQMITFEAQQNVPFPIDEVIWDHQFMPSRGAGGDWEAVIAASKVDVLEAQSGAVEDGGFRIGLIDLSTLALYNAFCYNYDFSEECTLLIDIGARTTNLLYMEKQFLYTRNVPIAGNLISQNLCNDLQEPFSIIEVLKKNKGYVSLGADYTESEDGQAAHIAKVTRSTLTRLHQEINRSTSFYRTQAKGSVPQRIFLAGGTALTPYFDLFLQEKLNVPVAYFNPLQNVGLSSSLNASNLARQAPLLGEVVGMASRALGNAPIAIDLTPPMILQRQKNSMRRPMMLLALAIWLVLFLCPLGFYFRQLNMIQRAEAEREQEWKQLDTWKSDLLPLENDYDRFNHAIQTTQFLLEQRDAWPKLLDDMNQQIPVGIWITQMDPTYNGKSLDVEVVAGGDSEGSGGRRNARSAHDRSAPKKEKGKKKEKDAKPEGEPPSFRTAPDINQLGVKGMFEKENRSDIVEQFVKGLEKTSWFEIDPKKISQAITSIETASESKPLLALTYNLDLTFKRTIDLKPYPEKQP